MKVILRDENGTEEILYEPNQHQYELKTEGTSLFTIIIRAWFILLVVLKGIIIIGFIALFIVAPIFGLILAFVFMPIILKTKIETMVLDNGLKTVIVTYKHNYKKNKTIIPIKFSDIKEIKIEDVFIESEYDFKIIFVKKNGNWYEENWLSESVDKNQIPVLDDRYKRLIYGNWLSESVGKNQSAWKVGIIGITMSKIIGVNCYYINEYKKSTMLYEAQ